MLFGVICIIFGILFIIIYNSAHPPRFLIPGTQISLGYLIVIYGIITFIYYLSKWLKRKASIEEAHAKNLQKKVEGLSASETVPVIQEWAKVKIEEDVKKFGSALLETTNMLKKGLPESEIIDWLEKEKGFSRAQGKEILKNAKDILTTSDK
jgi:hypothetical protein